jgi:hypothetical protein
VHFTLVSTNDVVETALENYPHTRAMPGCWVVQVPGFGIYEKVEQAISQLAEAESFHFIMTPIAATGQYYGRLPESVAAAIDRLCEPES